jgi:hypothetical protein
MAGVARRSIDEAPPRQRGAARRGRTEAAGAARWREGRDMAANSFVMGAVSSRRRRVCQHPRSFHAMVFFGLMAIKRSASGQISASSPAGAPNPVEKVSVC